MSFINKDSMVLALCHSLLILLICILVSIHYTFADVKKGPIGYTPFGKGRGFPGLGLIKCCQTSTDSEGIEITNCVVCDDTEPPSNCVPAPA